MTYGCVSGTAAELNGVIETMWPLYKAPNTDDLALYEDGSLSPALDLEFY